jgi:PPE-repeat protein
MTAPVWMASPPEVHSALLSGGPGPGSLLAAAGAWTSLSAEYASAAGELTTLLGAVQAGAWEGPSAEQYVSAHAPYLAWLSEASANSAGVAAQHEIAAAAYTSALAAMPTLPELAANHVIHGVLIATNFFGINTIPIALNEADYARMWIQAATTMASYQAVSGSALASAPRTSAAPLVVKANSATAAADPPSSGSNFLTEMFNQLVQLIENPGQTLNAIIANPSAWFPLLFFVGYQAFFEPVGWTTWSMLLTSPVWLSIIIGVPLNAMASLAGPVAVPAAAGGFGIAARAGEAAGLPVAGLSSPGVTTATTAGSTPATGVASGAAGAATPATGGFAYLVGGIGPDEGPGPTLIDRKGAKAPGRYIPAAAAVGAVARDKVRARRRRRAELRDYGDEFADMDSDLGPSTEPEEAPVLASDSGAGSLGFVGTVRKDTGAEATGLATLSGNGFGGGPSMPMVPATWGPDAPDGEGEHS